MSRGERCVKSLKSTFLLSLIASITFLSSCNSDNMDGWPYINLPDEISNYQSVSIEMIENEIESLESNSENLKYFSESNEMVLLLYNTIENMQQAPQKTENQLDGNYWQKVSVIFEDVSLDYKFEYYSYGVTDGYFIFDDQSIYEFKGDFYSVVKNCINKNLDSFIKVK